MTIRENNQHQLIDTSETCCESPDIFITTDGENVCRNCGTCLGMELVEQDRRFYTTEEVKARRRTEPVWRHFGSRTVISANKSDCKGMQLSLKKRELFFKLSKVQNSLVSSIERNYWEAKPKLNTLASKLGIPDYIIETAWKIYAEAARQRLTAGRSIRDFTCASLYAAVRIHNFPRLLEEFIKASQCAVRSVHRALGLLINHVFPKLNFKYRPISARPLVFRFGNELNLSIAVQQAASNLLKTVSSKGFTSIGKDPKGLAAAALYICARMLHESRTQTEIAEVALITEVTLRTREKQIEIVTGVTRKKKNN